MTSGKAVAVACAAAAVLTLGVARAWHAVWREVRIAMVEAPGREAIPVAAVDGGVLINGRSLSPPGRTILVESYAWGLAVSPDETRAALVRPNALEVVDLSGAQPARRVPPLGTEPDPALGTGAYMGVAFSPDGRILYAGSADSGEIKALDASTLQVMRTYALDDEAFHDSFAGDFVVSRDGTRLYVLDQFNFRLVTLDLSTGTVAQSVRVGRHPFSLALSPDGAHAWVTNVGMFEYPLLPGVTPENRATAGLTFPAYGVPSIEAERGTMAEGLQVPGLGSPNHPDAMSVMAVDLRAGRVVSSTKTGYLVGAMRHGRPTIGGASPGGVVAGRRAVYVTNATNDTVSVLDASTGGLVADVALDVPGLDTLRGVIPFGAALSPDERTLFVACAGLNAVAIVDTDRRTLVGYMPAGWFASSVTTSRDGRTLFVVSAKGIGSGPNGGAGFVEPARGLHPGHIMQGTLQVVPVPDAASLASLTRRVVDQTVVTRTTRLAVGHPLVPALTGAPRQGPIKHIVFVVKENRTFDQVFGQRGGVRGDASLTTLGLNMRVASKDGTRVLDRVDISPNHHALADRFAISDNFYCDADQSNTGHRWVAGVYPNEWVEVNARSRIEARLFSTAPGRRYVSGSSAVVLPEDYNEAGALWEHLARHHVPFYNFGFGTEMPASLEEQAFKETGIRMAVSFPLPKPLFDRTSRTYATYNMAIPDQYRMDMFEQEFRDRWLSKREPFPSLITLVLPNDHLTSEHPEDGYPFSASYMADNDLALGRLIETLSHSPWWRDMLVIVTEDDPQGGRDSVDAHRSLLMLIGPHVKRGYVSHDLADFGSIMRLIFTLLGLPPLNQFDATAPLPLDLFTDTPDLRPYRAVPSDLRLFDPRAAFKPFDREFNWRQVVASVEMDDPEDMQRPFADDGDDLAPIVRGRTGAPRPR